MKSINIKGKEYVMVNERIKHFRSSEKYAGYSIITEMVSNVDGVVVFKTTILDNTNRIVSTGYAHEIEGSSNINQTSHIENCETGSVGRALGFLGIGVDTSIATAEEVINAEKRGQTATTTTTTAPTTGYKRTLPGGRQI
jgi:hypothetical protein